MIMSEHMSAKDFQRKIVRGEDDTFIQQLTITDQSVRKAKEKLKRGLMRDKNTLSQPTEHEIQSAILERLALTPKSFFWRENSGLMKVGEDDKKRFFRAGIPGIPDIMGLYNGVPVGIECKRPGKKQSMDQKAFQQKFEACGGIYVVCTDATQVMNQIHAALSFRNGE